MRTSIWLIRHGQTRFNQERRYEGTSDSPLTAYGKRQTLALAARLRRVPFYTALTSPSERTRLAAATILDSRRHVTVHGSSDWRETDHGRWEGLTYREVLARYPAEAHARWADGIHGRAAGGESLAEVYARVTAAWHDLLRDHAGDRILIVTHATPIQLVLCATFGLGPAEHWHWRIDLGSITCLDVYPTGTIVRMVNEVPRLSGADGADD
jgi:2,3-bisphosphoglycerate-dependent phosphoglycerate mutase/probable phosphoglycerate mutase